MGKKTPRTTGQRGCGEGDPKDNQTAFPGLLPGTSGPVLTGTEGKSSRQTSPWQEPWELPEGVRQTPGLLPRVMEASFWN